jgi:hypothetical protein
MKSPDTELCRYIAAEHAEIGETPGRGLPPPLRKMAFGHVAVCTTTSQEKAKRPRVRLGANGLNMSTKDPRKLYPQPPYSGKKQTPPGNEEEMSPKVDHGESSCEGTGLLEGRHALITGADSGMVVQLRLPLHERERMWPSLIYPKRRTRRRLNDS